MVKTMLIWGHCSGAGAAWLWQGKAGHPLNPGTVKEMSSFLSPIHPRLRVLGGTRFNTSQLPHAEWAEFGSYCFMLPRYMLSAICDMKHSHDCCISPNVSRNVCHGYGPSDMRLVAVQARQET